MKTFADLIRDLPTFLSNYDTPATCDIVSHAKSFVKFDEKAHVKKAFEQAIPGSMVMIFGNDFAIHKTEKSLESKRSLYFDTITWKTGYKYQVILHSYETEPLQKQILEMFGPDKYDIVVETHVDPVSKWIGDNPPLMGEFVGAYYDSFIQAGVDKNLDSDTFDEMVAVNGFKSDDYYEHWIGPLECKISTVEILIKEKSKIYFLYEDNNPHMFKIGSLGSLTEEQLLQKLQLGNPRLLKMYTVVHCDNVEFAEKFIHDHFHSKRQSNTWYKIDMEEIDRLVKFIKCFT